MIYLVLALLAIAAYLAAVHRANSLRYPHIDEVLADLDTDADWQALVETSRAYVAEKNRGTGPTVAAWNDPAE